MTRTLGIVMDPIQTITPYKDTSLAMLLEAQRRGYELHYLTQGEMYLNNGCARGRTRRLSVFDDNERWFELGAEHDRPLGDLSVILMRKDPPVDNAYIYTTQILDRAAAAGALVVNRPAALRDMNEKLAISEFAELCTPTLVDSHMSRLREFLLQHGDVVIKPLDGMGGASVFRLRRNDPNVGVVLETLTRHGGQLAMMQTFVPEIAQGDKRILIVDGKPVDYALARIPAIGETRGNIAAGGRGHGQPLTDTDRRIANTVGPVLRERGVLFAGIDVIGDRLTEINVTSPTCVRELDAQFGLNICAGLFDAIESRLS